MHTGKVSGQTATVSFTGQSQLVSENFTGAPAAGATPLWQEEAFKRRLAWTLLLMAIEDEETRYTPFNEVKNRYISIFCRGQRKESLNKQLDAPYQIKPLNTGEEVSYVIHLCTYLLRGHE